MVHFKVCGPNWVDPKYWNNYETVFGMCYWAKASDISNVPNTSQDPLYQKYPFFGKTRELVQQAGFSIHMVPDSSPLEFVMGCPGPVGWHGIQIHYKESWGGFVLSSYSQNEQDILDYAG